MKLMSDSAFGRPSVADAIRRQRGLMVIPDEQGMDLRDPLQQAIESVGAPRVEMPEVTATNEDLAASTQPPAGGDPTTLNSQIAKTVTGAAMPSRLPPAAPAPQPATVPADPHADDVYNAQEADRKSHLTSEIANGTRELSAGLLHQRAPSEIAPAASQVPAAIQAAKDRRQAVVDAIARKRQGELDTSKMALEKSETDKNNREKPDTKAGDNDAIRALLLSPVYSGALAAKGMTPEAVKALSGKALEELQGQLKTDTTNSATVDAARQSAGINASRQLGNAKDLHVFESNLPRNMPEGMVDQLIGLNGSDAAITKYENDLKNVNSFAGKAGATLGNLGASQGILGSGAAQGANFNKSNILTGIALARGLEGGMAKPGNVEIIHQTMAAPTDSDEVKAASVRNLRSLMASKRAAFDAAVKAGNFKFQGGPAAPGQTQESAPRDYVKKAGGYGYFYENGELHKEKVSGG